MVPGPRDRSLGVVLVLTAVLASLAAVVTGTDGSAAAEVVALLPGSRCMMLVEGRQGMGTPLLAAPIAGSLVLGAAPDPVIAFDPLRIVHGFARVMQSDGRPGWVRRDRLREWSVTASPQLRCIPARMSDGSLGFTYAHPG